MLAGEPGALLAMVTLPLSAPAAAGPKITLKVEACPGVSVTGALAPLRVKPAPLSEICEICTLAFPELVMVTGRLDELPSFTLPNARLVVLKDRLRVAATPVPLRGKLAGELGALLTTLTLP